jgi:predicted transcriptional regulator
MRITVELPDDLHHRVTSLATHMRRSFSQTAAHLMQQGLVASSRSSGSASAVRMDAKTGLPVLYNSRAITPADVDALEYQS